MIRRRLWISLVGIVLVAVVGFGANVIAGNEPSVGLDLDGGVSVVLTAEQGATTEDLEEIRDLIRNDLEERGIAEPDVRIDGLDVVVDIPDVDDQEEAIDVVQAPGVVTIRPLMQQCTDPTADGAATSEPTDSSEPTASTAPTTTTEPSGSTEPQATEAGSTVPGSSEPAATASSETTAPAPETSASATTAGPAGPPTSAADPINPGAGIRRPAAIDATTPATTAAATTTPTTAPATTDASATSEPGTTPSTEPTESSEPTGSTEPTESSEPTGSTEPTESTEPPLGPLGPVTSYPDTEFGPPDASEEDSVTELPTADGQLCPVGPAQRNMDGTLGGQVFVPGTSDVFNNQVWVVQAELTPEGFSSFSQLASSCTARDQQACPLGAYAVVVDGVIRSITSVQPTSAAELMTVAQTETRSQAQAIADVIDRGTFPVEVELKGAQTVSAALGDNAGVAVAVAGIAGLLLVVALLWFVYRRLVLVALAGLVVSVLLVFGVAAVVSELTNYAVSLAAVVGLLVAAGVAVDSYVVYFERLKEEVRHGRSLRNSALRSFKTSWRAIFTAHVAAAVASIALYLAGQGAVRSFAVYLGAGTVCAAVVSFFFARPAVGLLADRGWLDRGDTFGLKEYQ